MNDASITSGPPPLEHDHRHPWPVVAMTVALLVSMGLSVIAWVTCGMSLALFFMSFFIVTPLLPPMVLSRTSLRDRLMVAGCAVDGIGIVWLAAVFTPSVTLAHWIECYFVLLSFAFILAGITLVLVRIHLAPIAASAITIVLSLAWLTWPVWLSAHLTESQVSRLVAVHPLFAVNGILVHLGVWTHFPIAYRSLTTLGQDVAYALPDSIWPATILHVAAGAALLVCSRIGGQRRASVS